MTINVLQAKPPFLEMADIFSPVMYDWYTFRGSQRFNMSYNRGRGSNTVTLKNGDVFGVRAATTKGAGYRVILDSLGPSRVLTIDEKQYKSLMSRSKPRSMKEKPNSKGDGIQLRERKSVSDSRMNPKAYEQFSSDITDWYEQLYSSGTQQNLATRIVEFIKANIDVELPSGNVTLYRGAPIDGLYSTRNVIKLKSGRADYHSWSGKIGIAREFYKATSDKPYYILKATIPSSMIAWSSASLIKGIAKLRKELEAKYKQAGRGDDDKVTEDLSWAMDSLEEAKRDIKGYEAEDEYVINAKGSTVLAYPVEMSTGVLSQLMTTPNTPLNICAKAVNEQRGDVGAALSTYASWMKSRSLGLSYLQSMRLILVLGITEIKGSHEDRLESAWGSFLPLFEEKLTKAGDTVPKKIMDTPPMEWGAPSEIGEYALTTLLDTLHLNITARESLIFANLFAAYRKVK